MQEPAAQRQVSGKVEAQQKHASSEAEVSAEALTVLCCAASALLCSHASRCTQAADKWKAKANEMIAQLDAEAKAQAEVPPPRPLALHRHMPCLAGTACTG